MRYYTIKVMCMGDVLHDGIGALGVNALEAFENSNIYLPSGAAYEVEVMNTSSGLIFRFEVVKP